MFNSLEEKITVAVLFVALILGFVYHERGVGAAREREAQAREVAAQAAAQEKKEEEARKKAESISETYLSIIKNPIAPVPPVRVYVPAAVQGAGKKEGGDTVGTDSSAQLRKENQGFVTWDPTPAVTAGRDADAKVRALQEFIRTSCWQP
jgi:hypothetical protein